MHTFILNSKEEITMSGELFQTVAALVYLNRTTKHHGVLPIKLVRNQLNCDPKNAKVIVDYISEHLVVSIGKQVELSVPVPAVVYVAPGEKVFAKTGAILDHMLRNGVDLPIVEIKPDNRSAEEIYNDLQGYPKLKDDNPDRYCYTEADGSCSSTDPRCMHNRLVDEYSHGSTCDRTKVGISDGENQD